jgi:hypothetical protein
MGWKSAGAHFQQQLAHTVLSGLLCSECELYIDDILALASSEEELLERLRWLFERFRKYNVTLNPEKCEIVLDRVDYVGHLINAEGMHFTRTKLDSVATTLFGIKQFSILAMPLLELVNGYTKSMKHRKVWLEGVALATFHHLMDLIEESQMLLYFDLQPTKYT